MRESSIEKYFVKRVKKDLGGTAFKFVSPAQRGVPDRIVLLPYGRVYFVEFKAPGKKLTKLQQHIATTLREMGFEVDVIDSKELVDAWIAGDVS